MYIFPLIMFLIWYTPVSFCRSIAISNLEKSRPSAGAVCVVNLQLVLTKAFQLEHQLIAKLDSR